MRQNVRLEVEKIEKVMITDIMTQQIAAQVSRKYVMLPMLFVGIDIDVMVLGMKEQKHRVPLLMQVEVRLHRENIDVCLPDRV